MLSRGVTLVELVTALAILGVVSGISGVALASLRMPRQSEAVRELQRARAAAIRTGRSVSTPGHLAPDSGFRFLFLPDGRALGPGADPLTGAPHAKR